MIEQVKIGVIGDPPAAFTASSIRGSPSREYTPGRTTAPDTWKVRGAGGGMRISTPDRSESRLSHKVMTTVIAITPTIATA
jgi:hypothetical protein